MSYSDFLSLENFLLVLSIAVFIGLIAGIYPSFYLTSFKPVAVLKGSFAHSKKGGLLRKSLIIAQYAIASVLIIWILVVSQQIRFMKNREVGFDKASLVELTLPDDKVALKSVDAFLERLRLLPQVRGAAKTMNDLSSHYGSGGQLMEGPEGQRLTTSMSMISAG